MSDLPLIVTNAGRAALVNAANTGTAPVTIASVGVSATQITASTTTAALPGEIKRIATISGDVVADDTIHLIVRDDSAAVYSVRSFALYLNDGTLFAAYGQAGVIIEKSSLALLLLALDVRFADVAATQLTFGNTNFLNPPATEAAPGVMELATLEEAAAGVDAVRAITPKTAKASVPAWLGYTPANRAGDTFSGPIRRDPNFYMNVQDGYAILAFDPNDYQSYQRATNTYELILGGASRFLVNSVTVSIGGQTVWHAGNDGAGSGADADLLDGQQGSWYTDIVGRLGYQPANRAGDIFTGSLSIARTGSPEISVNSLGAVIGRLVAQSDGGIVLYRDNGVQAAPVFSVYNQAGPFAVQMPITRSGNTVWDAGNDGAGSGADADLLDGQQGSWYTDIVGRLGFVPANRNGDIFTGPVTIYSAGAASLDLNSAGAVVGRLAAQNDGNLVLYRSVGGGYVPVFGIASQAGPFAVQMPITRSGNTVWDAGNDGAGSGADADLLDGQQGSWYADIVGRLGFVPANVAGQAFAGDISAPRMITTANGAGRNVAIGNDVWLGDVDRFATMSLRGQTGGASGFISFGSSDAGLGVQGGGPLLYGGQMMWHAGSDGAGSGLDADMLDGHHASDFATPEQFASLINDNGYQRLPGGLLLQWGLIGIAAGTTGYVDLQFPIMFPNRCFNAVSCNAAGGSASAPVAWASTGNFAKGGMRIGMSSASGVGAPAGTAAYWFAIGY